MSARARNRVGGLAAVGSCTTNSAGTRDLASSPKICQADLVLTKGGLGGSLEASEQKDVYTGSYRAVGELGSLYQIFKIAHE